MRRKRKDWFTIVATDLFMGSFAAILIIDALTPKEIGATSSAQRVQISFAKPSSVACPTEGGAIVFSFMDSGTPIDTLAGFSAKSSTERCEISGFVKVFLDQKPEQPCILISEFLGEDPDKVSVEITGLYSEELVPGGCS